MTAFLDASYLLALELRNDQNHSAAVAHWRAAFTSPQSFVTTSYVFDEVVTLLNTRGYHHKAAQVGSALLRSLSVHLVHVDRSLFQEAWTYFQQHSDKAYSFTDCVSFTLMKNLHIEVAFAFDKHFLQAGFTTVP